MRTHKECFRGEIRKILQGYPLLSGIMTVLFWNYYIVVFLYSYMYLFCHHEIL